MSGAVILTASWRPSMWIDDASGEPMTLPVDLAPKHLYTRLMIDKEILLGPEERMAQVVKHEVAAAMVDLGRFVSSSADPWSPDLAVPEPGYVPEFERSVLYTLARWRAGRAK